MSPTPASLHPPPLASMPRAAFLRLPPFPAYISPPFVSLDLHPGPCQPLGGSSVVGPSVSLLSLPLPPFMLRRFTESSGSWSLYQVSIFAQGQGARASPLPGNRHSLAIARPRPFPAPSTWTHRRRQATQISPLPSPSPSPPCRLVPIPSVEVCGV